MAPAFSAASCTHLYAQTSMKTFPAGVRIEGLPNNRRMSSVKPREVATLSPPSIRGRLHSAVADGVSSIELAVRYKRYRDWNAARRFDFQLSSRRYRCNGEKQIIKTSTYTSVLRNFMQNTQLRLPSTRMLTAYYILVNCTYYRAVWWGETNATMFQHRMRTSRISGIYQMSND